MAERLQRAGFNLTVFDVRDEAVRRLRDLGARPAGSPGDVAAGADVVLTCVLYDHQVQQIFHGEDGILAGASPGLVVTVHSTVPPQVLQELAVAAAGRGVDLVDAPVSGASLGAEQGTLTCIVGGSDDAVVRVRPVLAAVASDIVHVGPVGAAQVVKLANNIMFHGNQLIAMEAIRFVQAFGLDKEVLLDVAAVSTGGSWVASHFEHFDRYGTEHTLAGSAELPHRFGKDLRYAIAVAQERCTYLPLTALASQLLPGMFAERWGIGSGSGETSA
jgi:3-hydroxyisobutyrate dehydrogenase-like beta-hydroxyacid dehydrogenase